MSNNYEYYVYIMASKTKVLYIGVTGDIDRRVHEHKEGLVESFTKKYRCHRLVYFEEYKYVYDALTREKELKGWMRYKKITLIEEVNPSWDDLSTLD